jgi:hypothetical protein
MVIDLANGGTLTLTLSLTQQGRGDSPLPFGERIKVRGMPLK